jgi:hypothetical protein
MARTDGSWKCPEQLSNDLLPARSIRKFARTARRYRIVQIRVGQHTLTAGDPRPSGLRDALALVK